MPVRWVDGWPMLGDDNGNVPFTGKIPLKPYDTGNRIVESDDFSSNQLKNVWQWNHNPVNNAWSLKERKGYLRLRTSRVVDNIFLAPNSLTQRMEGPKCSGTVSLDVSKMKNGDVAGISAFNGDAGLLSVTMIDNKKWIIMSENSSVLDNSTKAVKNVVATEKEKIELTSEKVFLRIDADFNLNKDIATFYFSVDNKNWIKIGTDYKMIFDYRRMFMGSKFAIYNFATKEIGGYVDVNAFNYKRMN